MQNLTSPACYLAFASGFTLGNFLGILIEQKLALGNMTVQITTGQNANALIGRLREAGYGVTKMEGQGASGRVEVVTTVVQRKNLPNVATLIQEFDPHAFYSVQEVKKATEGVFPQRAPRNATPSLLSNALRGQFARSGMMRTMATGRPVEVSNRRV